MFPSEEGLSFDCHGNNPEQWPENSYRSIVSVAAVQKERVIFERTLELSIPSGWADDYIAVVLTGNSIGKYAAISESTDDHFVLSASAPILSVGDKILVTTGYFRNRIDNNAVYGAGTYGIGFWGSSWWNTVRKNVVMECMVGIQANSVISGQMKKVQSYSGCNVICENTIVRTTPRLPPLFSPASGIAVLSKVYGEVPPLVEKQNPFTRILGNYVEDSGGIVVRDAWKPVVEHNVVI
jgi:hypothetical protein